MFRIHRCLAAVALAALFALPGARVLGQDPPAGDNEQPRPRRPRAQRPAMMVDNRGLKSMIDKLPKDLDLTEEQQSQLKAIADKHKDALKPASPGDAAGNEKIQALREEMNKAREDGDEDKMQEIRGKMMEASQAQRAAQTKARDALFTDISAMLTPEQKPKFDKIKAQFANQRGGRGGMGDPAMLREAVDHIKLGPAQKAKIDELFKNFRRDNKPAARDGGPPTPAQMEANRKLRESVMSELSQDQKDEVQKYMREHMRGGRGGRGGPGRGGPDQPQE